MPKQIKEHKNTYLFIFILSIIGFITGYFYYQIQPKETKTEIIEKINVQEDLKTGSNNITKGLKEISIIYTCGIIPIFQINNIINIFIKPLQIGFIFNFLTSYHLKLALIYTLTYHIIPILFYFVLIRISFTISKFIIKYLFTKERTLKRKLIQLSKKYLIISIVYLLYEIIISILSSNINLYLMVFI